MRALSCLFLVLMSVPAPAEMEVRDPKQVLQRLWWNNSGTFETDFVCGSKSDYIGTKNFVEIKCSGNSCTSKWSEATTPADRNYSFHVADCEPDLVHVYGDNGLSVAITKADYLAGSSTWLVSFLKGVGHFIQPEGIIEFNFSFPKQMFLIRNGRKQPLQAYEIWFKYKPMENVNGSMFKVYVAPSLVGVEQIVLFTDDQGSDEFFRLKGLIDERPF